MTSIVFRFTSQSNSKCPTFGRVKSNKFPALPQKCEFSVSKRKLPCFLPVNVHFLPSDSQFAPWVPHGAQVGKARCVIPSCDQSEMESVTWSSQKLVAAINTYCTIWEYIYIYTWFNRSHILWWLWEWFMKSCLLYSAKFRARSAEVRGRLSKLTRWID